MARKYIQTFRKRLESRTLSMETPAQRINFVTILDSYATS